MTLRCEMRLGAFDLAFDVRSKSVSKAFAAIWNLEVSGLRGVSGASGWRLRWVCDVFAGTQPSRMLT